MPFLKKVLLVFLLLLALLALLYAVLFDFGDSLGTRDGI